MKKLLALWLFMLLFVHSMLLAGTTGKISGKLKDADTGEPLIGATVVVVGTNLGAVSDQDGFYSIINILPGTYQVKASFIGYNQEIQKDVVVNADRTTRIDFSLKSSAVSTGVVEVVATKEEIIKDLTSSFSVVGSDQIKTLPVESIGDILQLQAGITKDVRGEIHMRGGRSDEVQYYVDGMALTNPFSGSGMAVGMQNINVQEIQVISGTFNAEYGQAMSGIVNIVTKDGGDKTEASFSAYAGDFLTTHKDIFLNIDKINPLSQKYVEGSLSGPVPFTDKQLRYFISGRFSNEENWLYGQRIYIPSDTADFSSPNPALWTIQKSGDSAMVPLNPYRNGSLQVKLTYNPVGNLKLSYLGSYENAQWKQYSMPRINQIVTGYPVGVSHANMYNPDFLPTEYRNGLNNLFTITHTISDNYFHELRISHYQTHHQIHASDSPYDSVFVGAIRPNRTVPANVFNIGGMDTHFLDRKNTTTAVKYEITGQVNRYNLVKLGAEYRMYELEEDNFSVVRANETNWHLFVYDVSSTSHNYYLRKPVEFAAYLQDKIEVEDLVVNVGLRFDYYNPKSQVPTDMTNPHADYRAGYEDFVYYKDATPKSQLSPRIGLAFPISERGNIHASYGQFFQMPSYDMLYENPEFEVSGQRFQTHIGNADLEAQRTTIFEVGLQQKVAQNLILDATAYYRDFRNLAGSQFWETYDYNQYGQYANADFGNSWGVTFSLDLLKTGMLSASVDYTFQVADGNGSDPREAFYNRQNMNEESKTLVPLNWDQRHVLNATVFIEGDGWGITSINRFNSGYPYNPETNFFPNSNVQLQNQGRLKPEYNMDIRLYKNLNLMNVSATLFVNILNVFDFQRIDLFPSIPWRDLVTHQNYARFNSLYDYRMDPGEQPAPRQIRMGFRIDI